MNSSFWFLVFRDWWPTLAPRARRCVTARHVCSKSFTNYQSPSTNHRCSRRGFALLDVIIGALLLGAGLAVIISLSTRSLAAQTQGEKRMVAAWLADELLSMVIVEGPEEYSHRYDLQGQFYEPFEEFLYRIDIRDNGPGVAHTVVAHIEWEVGRNMTEGISIESAIAQRRGDPDQPREPREWVDREQRHYERLFGKDEEDEESTSQSPITLPTNPVSSPAGGAGSGDRGGTGGRGGGGGMNRGGIGGGARGGR